VVIYSAFGMPDRFAARTIGWIIQIRPSHRDDTGLLAHEKHHVAQLRRQPLTFWLRYFLSKRARLAYEAEAYRVQLDHYPDRLDVLAAHLANSYGLGITRAQAREAILSAPVQGSRP
jgi:hypothetical protein